TYPIYILIVGLFMGISAGLSAVIGRLLGEGYIDRASYLIGLSLVIFGFLSAIIGLVCYLLGASVFELLGMSDDLYPLVADYINPLFFGMPLLSAVLIANASLMAKGVMLKPMLVMAVGGFTNLILDYVFIFGWGPVPALALTGAAIATVISWGIMLGLMLILLVKEHMLPLHFAESLDKVALYADVRDTARLATPAIAAQILTPLSVAVITRIVSAYGENAVAAYGIVTRIESLALTGILALSVIITPLVAQNYGAYRQGNVSFLRLDNIIALSGRIAVYWGVIFYVILALIGRMLVTFFTPEQQIVDTAYRYLLIVGFSFPAFGLALISASFFNGIQLPMLSLKLTLAKTLLFTLPLAALGSLFSETFIWVGLGLCCLIRLEDMAA
ncbi:MATE family efflux transporter, partial [Enterovibrio nigricans]